MNKPDDDRNRSAEPVSTPAGGAARDKAARPATKKCPTCGFAADMRDIRCPRCNTLLVTGCTGSCGTCGVRGCAGNS